MTRRRRILVLFLLLLIVLGVAVYRFPVWSSELLAARLSEFFHRPVTVTDVRLHLYPLEAEIVGLKVAGFTPQALPFLEAARVLVTPSPGSFFGPRIAISRLRLEGFRMRINAFTAGGDDIPEMGGGGDGGGGTEVRIRRLVIENGAFYLNHRRVPLELDLPGFAARLAQRRPGVMAGSVSFGPGRLQFSDAPSLPPIGTEIDLNLEGSLLTVEKGRVHTGKIDLAYTGQIRIMKDPEGEFHLTGPVDLEELDRHIMQTGFGLKGNTRFRGSLTVNGPRLRVKGHFDGTDGVYEGVPVPQFASDVAWNETGVHLRKLELSTLGGSGVLNVEVPPDPGTVKLEAVMKGVDAEGLVQNIFGIGAPGLAGAASGDLSIEWPRGRVRLLSGRMALDLASREDGRTPLSGRFEWRAEKGVQFIEAADLRTPATGLRLKGRIDVDDRTDLSVDGQSTDLAATDDLGARLRQALGTRDARLAGFSGSGLFRGRWTGTLQVPVFEGRFAGPEVNYLGVAWGRAEWAGVADPDEVRSHSLVLRRPGGELWLDGRTETGMRGERDGVDARVRFENWPAADFIKVFALDLDASGLLSGEATFKGRRSAPLGQARLSATDGTYYGIPYADLSVSARFRGPLTEVTAGGASVGGGRISFHGTLTDDGFYDGTAEMKNVEVASLLPPAVHDVRWGGRLSADLVLQGTLARPRMRAHFSSPRLFFGDEGVGALEARLTGDGGGAVGVEGGCRSPRLDLALTGRVDVAAPHGSDLRLAARDTSLDPFLRVAFPQLTTQAGVVATGELTVRGPLDFPRDLAAEATVSELQLVLPDYPIRNQGPLRLALEGGQARVKEARLAGEGTSLTVAGEAMLLAEGPLRLDVRGAADLQMLSVVTPRLRGHGAARLALAVLGTRDAPRVEGTLDLEGAGVRLRGFPHGLEDVRGTIRFTEAAAHVEGAKGAVAGGPVEWSGQAAYSQGRLVSFDVQATGRGLSLRYPEGLRSVIDANLRFFGDATRQTVGGEVDVRQALWSKRYDVASELLSSGPTWTPAASLGEGVHYDLKVRAPGTLKIDNNLATLQARADLNILGTYDAPTLLGRAEIDRGRVYFQGNTYVIRRGTIDFANPQRIDPLFDMEAETRIRSYRVTLKMNGTLERIYPTLTSDPPLTAVQILNLLAGADEATVTSQALSQTNQANVAAAGAATLAAGKVQEEVGLGRGAERLFGLNRFSIDPAAVKGGSTFTTARLTVGKRITPDLNVFYSVDLHGAPENVVSLDYTLSERFSVSLTRSTTTGIGFDVLWRHSH